MNIENHFFIAKNCLDHAQHKLNLDQFDSTLAMLAEAYCNVRSLMEKVFELKRDCAESKHPDWKDGT